MIHFYDDKLYHPYLCINKISEEELKRLVDHLKKNNLEPNKFYQNPKYPASDGVFYDYILRLPFGNNESAKKHPLEKIDGVVKSFLNLVDDNNLLAEPESAYIDPMAFLKSEKDYLKKINALLDSERKVLETDKNFFKKQVEKLNELIHNLQSENTVLLSSFNQLSDRLTENINALLSNKGVSDDEVFRMQEALKQKEQFIKERETAIHKKEKELAQQSIDLKEFKEEQEKNYRERVAALRAEILGINQIPTDIKSGALDNLKILCMGESHLSRADIWDIFNNIFYRNFDLELPEKSIDMPALNYKKMKTVNISELLKNNKYDYVIVGPRPHSTKNKNINESIKSLAEKLQIKTIVFDRPKDSLNKSMLSDLAGSIANDWYERHQVA